MKMEKIKNIIKKVAIITAVLPIVALAHDPGVGNGPEPRVPQGPNVVVCLNQGRQGIDTAILNGGMVHCDSIHVL